jgi:hypothetical protein
LEVVVFACTRLRFSKHIDNPAPRMQPFRRLASAARPVSHNAMVATAVAAGAALALLLLGANPSGAQGRSISVNVDGEEIDIPLTTDWGPQVDGSSYHSENGDQAEPGSWIVENPDGTNIIHAEFTHPKDGTKETREIVSPGKDCTIPEEKTHTVRECRPNQAKQLVIFDVTYYEYTCQINGGTIKRRISHIVPTDTPCTVDDYRSAALNARDWDEKWPEPPQPPPPPPPPVTCTAVPHGKVRPIYVATAPDQPGYLQVIWVDEEGNQFVAIYNADGTSIWEAAGSVPARPSDEELGKAKSLSASEFREIVDKMAKQPGKDCEKLTPPQPKPPETRAGPPKSEGKKPRKGVPHKTGRTAGRTHRRGTVRARASENGQGVPLDIGVGLGILGRGGGLGRHGGAFGDHGGSR